jgi:hypothetical protein
MKVGGQHHTHLLYPWEMSTWYSQNRRLGQTQSHSAVLEANIKISCPFQERNNSCLEAHNLITTPTTLSWLLLIGKKI